MLEIEQKRIREKVVNKFGAFFYHLINIAALIADQS